MTKLTRMVAITGVIAAAIAASLAASQTAAASQPATASQKAAAMINPMAANRPANASKSATAARRCGWLGGETYRHCSTRTWVLIDADNIWGKTFRNICVGPGDTHLGYLDRWVIAYAWYIGKLCRR